MLNTVTLVKLLKTKSMCLNLHGIEAGRESKPVQRKIPVHPLLNIPGLPLLAGCQIQGLFQDLFEQIEEHSVPNKIIRNYIKNIFFSVS